VSERGDQWEDRDQEEQEDGAGPGQRTVERRGDSGESEGREGTNRGNRESGSGPGSPGSQRDASKSSPVLPRIPRQIDRDPSEGYWNTPG
jgi:hypothetical protein